jgi:hypothetical protein
VTSQIHSLKTLQNGCQALAIPTSQAARVPVWQRDWMRVTERHIPDGTLLQFGKLITFKLQKLMAASQVNDSDAFGGCTTQ